MVKQKAADLTAVFQALGDPTRRQLVEALGEGERTVGQLAAPLSMSLPAVSKHLGILERAGLLQRRKDGRNHYLRFDPASLSSATEWLENQRQFWEGSFDKLAAYLDAPSGKSPKSKAKK